MAFFGGKGRSDRKVARVKTIELVVSALKYLGIHPKGCVEWVLTKRVPLFLVLLGVVVGVVIFLNNRKPPRNGKRKSSFTLYMHWTK